MELKTFVKETLLQITEGIIEAQGELKESNSIINPADIQYENAPYATFKNKKRAVRLIEFNVGLTSTSEEQSNRKIGVALGAIKAGGDGNKGEKEIHATSIKFSIPVAFPAIDNENNPLPPTSIGGKPKSGW